MDTEIQQIKGRSRIRAHLQKIKFKIVDYTFILWGRPHKIKREKLSGLARETIEIGAVILAEQ